MHQVVGGVGQGEEGVRGNVHPVHITDVLVQGVIAVHLEKEEEKKGCFNRGASIEKTGLKIGLQEGLASIWKTGP